MAIAHVNRATTPKGKQIIGNMKRREIIEHIEKLKKRLKATWNLPIPLNAQCVKCKSHPYLCGCSTREKWVVNGKDGQGMSKLKISLMKWNQQGATAYLENDDGDSLQISLSKTSQNAKKVCLDAAKKLRKLADDFECLAEMDKPFHFKTQEAVAKRKVKLPPSHPGINQEVKS